MTTPPPPPPAKAQPETYRSVGCSMHTVMPLFALGWLIAVVAVARWLA